MLCYQCKKKTICKYYDSFLDAMRIASIKVEACEHFSGSYEEEMESSGDLSVKVKMPYVTPTTLDKMADNLKGKEPRFFFPDLKQKEETREKDLMTTINQFAKTDIYIQEPEYREGVCSHCNQETQVYTCECGNVSCEECGMPPYCKTCWEEK